MRRQVLVLGLGQFGAAVAVALSEQGVDVLAVDSDAARVRAVADLVTEAVCLDATDEAALAALGPADRDLCICAIGNDGREASIVASALLKQMGVKRLIARATDPIHERILTLLGADEVVNPELAFAGSLASRLAHAHIRSVTPVRRGLVLTEVAAPSSFIGRNLAALEIPRRFGVTVVAVGRVDAEVVDVPRGDRIIQEGDLLLIAAAPGVVQAMLEKVS
ncbi:MAG: hypothetical protein RJA70_3292 [Pseudomonadota bacterium]|jgi:trk system potassium uptake protein TrkA